MSEILIVAGSVVMGLAMGTVLMPLFSVLCYLTEGEWPGEMKDFLGGYVIFGLLGLVAGILGASGVLP